MAIKNKAPKPFGLSKKVEKEKGMGWKMKLGLGSRRRVMVCEALIELFKTYNPDWAFGYKVPWDEHGNMHNMKKTRETLSEDGRKKHHMGLTFEAWLTHLPTETVVKFNHFDIAYKSKNQNVTSIQQHAPYVEGEHFPSAATLLKFNRERVTLLCSGNEKSNRSEEIIARARLVKMWDISEDILAKSVTYNKHDVRAVSIKTKWPCLQGEWHQTMPYVNKPLLTQKDGSTKLTDYLPKKFMQLHYQLTGYVITIPCSQTRKIIK